MPCTLVWRVQNLSKFLDTHRPFFLFLPNFSNQIQGLHWLSEEKNIFRMPWKHAGRQDYNLDDDSKIFKVSKSKVAVV